MNEPDALTREQVEKLCWDIRNCDVLGNEIDDMIAHDSALRATITQQAQEIERLECVSLDRLKSGQRLADEYLLLQQQLASMTMERDEMILRRSETVAMCDQLMRERNLLQHRFDDAIEAIDRLTKENADLRLALLDELNKKKG